MSSTVRIALVAEGITDFEVLKACIESMLSGGSFIVQLLQPEGSVAFDGAGNAGAHGGGWKGVYRWCRQAAVRGGGAISGDPLFAGYDLLILHLDADVAGEDPASSLIDAVPELDGQLPCECACPPARATTDALRQVLLNWVGETATPPRTVLCTPSKSTEAWVMAALFPGDRELSRKGWECYPKPERRLAQQPLRQRISKSQADYEARAKQLERAWPSVVSRLPEANRFHDEFTNAVGQSS